MTNQTAAVIPALSQNSGNVPNPHYVLMPLMVQGHMIPMIDMARLIASRGVLVTFVTTPLNAARINSSINSIHASGLPIHFLILPFPCIEAGLPEGCENLDILPSRDLTKNFLDACSLLKDPLINHLKAHNHLPPPTLIISDLSLPWTREVSKHLSIPRLFFNGFGCFALLCCFKILQHKVHQTITDDNELFVIPGLPDRIELTRAQATAFLIKEMEKYMEEIREAEIEADGVVVNSFDELESQYCEWYQKTTGKKAWMIGPLSLSNKNIADVAARGNKAAIDEALCMSWLDSMKPNSVLYVSFGSMAHTKLDQLVELGLALEASEKPFVWVIKAGDKMAEVEKWLLSEGFEERTKSRGLIIRGWAPQVMILSHPAVGGFMTHCGWNSTLEGVTAGVPLITWPHFAEQFINEKLIVQVLKIGVSVGVKHPARLWVDGNGDALMVKKEMIEKAVVRLMGEGQEAEEMRKRAKELGEMAGRAMEEGGSSYQTLSNLIRHFNGAHHGQMEDNKHVLLA